MRLWSWVRLEGEDDYWELFNAEGKRVAAVHQDGERYWVARPRAIPEPPLESLEQAKRRAESYALAALPLPRPVEQPKGPHPLLRSRSTDWPSGDFVTSDWHPTGSGTDMPELPAFLRRDKPARRQQREPVKG